jgi:regulator of protease activity HflC (stomatin/prohibitin superfamily)
MAWHTVVWLILVVVLVLLVIYIFWTGIRIVPQGEVWIVERLGRYHRTLEAGLNVIIPFLDTIRAKITTRDIILDTEQQEVITQDNAVVITDAVAFYRITDPYRALYEVEDYNEAVKQVIMTNLRAIIGGMTLDEALSNRELIKERIKEATANEVADWGITVKTVEIQEINPSKSMQQAMEKQAAAERERRAMEIEAQGKKKAMILEAEGKLEAAKREAEAQKALAEASAQAIRDIAQSIEANTIAPMFLIGDRYINVLHELANSENSKHIVYPADLQGALKGLFPFAGGNIINLTPPTNFPKPTPPSS